MKFQLLTPRLASKGVSLQLRQDMSLNSAGTASAEHVDSAKSDPPDLEAGTTHSDNNNNSHNELSESASNVREHSSSSAYDAVSISTGKASGNE